jgi:hypothetical protein
MIEQKPEKKIVSRTVAIALGIICVVLAAGLVVAIMNYTSQVNDLSSILNLEKYQVWIDNINFSQRANFSSPVCCRLLKYEGYIVAGVSYQAPPTSAIGNVYINCTWVHFIMGQLGANYNEQEPVLWSGESFVFPVSASSIANITVGNTFPENYSNPSALYNQTVTITYWY